MKKASECHLLPDHSPLGLKFWCSFMG